MLHVKVSTLRKGHFRLDETLLRRSAHYTLRGFNHRVSAKFGLTHVRSMVLLQRVNTYFLLYLVDTFLYLLKVKIDQQYCQLLQKVVKNMANLYFLYYLRAI